MFAPRTRPALTLELSSIGWQNCTINAYLVIHTLGTLVHLSTYQVTMKADIQRHSCVRILVELQMQAILKEAFVAH